MKKKLLIVFISILTLVLFALGFAACKPSNSGGGGGEEPAPDFAIFEFSEKRVEIRVGEPKALTLLYTPYEEETVSYASNDESVLKVNGEGEITGEGVGTAVVKATSSLGRTALAQVTVHDSDFYPVPYFTVAKDDIRLNMGDKFALDYTFSYQGQPIDGAVTIESSDKGVVRVNGNELSAVGSGTANVVLSGTSPYGEATKTIKVTVSATLTEFYLSLTGKEIYVGKPMELVLYAVQNGTLKEIEDVAYSITGEQIATIEGNILTPEEGGDTTVLSTFTYNNRAQNLSLSIHIYGPHTVTVRLLDGTVDNTFTATYGDYIPLALKNEDGNPEYRRPIKSWYLQDGTVLSGEVFTMPDEDVTVTALFVNEVEENFIDKFTSGHLLNDLSSARAEYVSETLTDSTGGSSGLGYVNFSAPNWSSMNFWFDEAVTVNAFSTVSMRIYLPQPAALLYFGYASNENFSSANRTKRYEAGRDRTGDVPHQTLEYEKWVILEMPLSAFADVGQKLSGISICVSSNSYILIDYISVNYGLAATDPVYQDNALYKAILAEANGSKAQAEAIATYYMWALALSDEERSDAAHVEHVEAIKAILTEHFDSKIEKMYDNIPTVTGDATYTGDQKGTSNCNPNHNKVYDHYYMTQVNKGSYNATFTLEKVPFTTFDEVYFGMYAMTADILNDKKEVIEEGKHTMSFNGAAMPEADHTAHYYKVVIREGTLTVYADKKGDTGTVVFTTPLSEAVLNGEEALVISFDANAWSQVEITEMNAIISVNDII